MSTYKTTLALAMCAACVAQASASILVSNLAEPLRDFNDISATDWAAQGFNTDANSYILTDIRAMVGNETAASSPFAELRVADAQGDMDTSPGGLIATFTVPSMAGARSVRTFTPNSSVMLDPSTKYYFLLGNSTAGADTFEWSYAEGNGSTGPGTFDQYEYTFDGGATWTIFGTDNPFHMEVNVEAVPEPTTLAALAVGGISLMLRRRSKR